MKEITVLFEVQLQVDEEDDREIIIEDALQNFLENNYNSIIVRTSEWDSLKKEDDFLFDLAIDSECEAED